MATENQEFNPTLAAYQFKRDSLNKLPAGFATCGREIVEAAAELVLKLAMNSTKFRTIVDVEALETGPTKIATINLRFRVETPVLPNSDTDKHYERVNNAIKMRTIQLMQRNATEIEATYIVSDTSVGAYDDFDVKYSIDQAHSYRQDALLADDMFEYAMTGGIAAIHMELAL